MPAADDEVLLAELDLPAQSKPLDNLADRSDTRGGKGCTALQVAKDILGLEPTWFEM